MNQFDRELDTTGLNCPMPVMRTKKALLDLDPGQVLHIISTDPATTEDIPELLGTTGDCILDSREDGGKFHFYIRKVDR